MKIELLVLHREESYEGEYAPEVVAVVDEYTQDDNPEYWPNEIEIHKGQHGSDVTWATVVIEIPQARLIEALYPAKESIVAEIVESRPA